MAFVSFGRPELRITATACETYSLSSAPTPLGAMATAATVLIYGLPVSGLTGTSCRTALRSGVVAAGDVVLD